MALRAVLRRFHSPGKRGQRLGDCGHRSVLHDGAVMLRVSDGVAGFAGLSTCGSVWSCPCCASKILARRAEEIGSVLAVAVDRGCWVGMATFTMRHRKGQSLRTLWDALSYAWSKVTSGKQWQADALRSGLVGWLRAVEVTHGKNGFHVHAHVLLVFDPGRQPLEIPEELPEGLSPSMLVKIEKVRQKYIGQDLAERMWLRWERALGRKGLDALRNFADGGGGLDFRVSVTEVSEKWAKYVTKQQANEAAFGPLKKARGENRTPFEIAQTIAASVGPGGELADDFDPEDVDVWQEWEQSSAGRRMITWSQRSKVLGPGLREWAGLGEEEADEDIAAEDLASPDRVALPWVTWHRLRKVGPWGLLDAAEDGGVAAALEWLRSRGLAFDVLAPPGGPPPDPAVEDRWREIEGLARQARVRDNGVRS